MLQSRKRNPNGVINMERIVGRLVEYTYRHLTLNSQQLEVVEYGLANLLTTAMTTLGVLVLGRFLGVMIESAGALVTGAAFRWVSGGAHLAKAYRCAVVSIVLPVGFALLSGKCASLISHGQWVWALVVLTSAAAIVTYRYGPVQTDNHPLSTQKQKKLRIYAWIVLAAWLVSVYCLCRRGWLSLAAASGLGLIWQLMSITPAGCRLFDQVDCLFDRWEGRKGDGR